MDVEEAYRQFRRQRHRPAHARRTAESVAAFFVPLVHPGHRLVDLGCGPGSVTAGLAAAVGPTGVAVGVDVDPGPTSVPLVRADIHALPLADRSVDAIFMCAVLQHVGDPLRPLLEARRIARSGAVIGVADADWGGAVIAPDDPWLTIGQHILTALRTGTSPNVGRDLRGLLHAAGFADARVTARSTGGSDGCAREGAFQAEFFEAPAAVGVVTARGLASASDMAAIAAAWRRWAQDPAATSARHWFEATARVP
jgi:SAM-dependent methyltransferase